MLYCPVNGGQVVSLLKQASDKEYAFIYYELFVQVKGGLQYYAVHVNIRLVCAAEGGVRSECYMYGTVYLFILEYQSGQPGGGIGTYAKLSHGGVSLAFEQYIQLLAAFALDALQLAILYFYQERRIQLAYTYHGAVYYHVSACSVLEGSDISLA